MIFTNNYFLPSGMVKALSEESHTNPARMSVTDLINPPLIRTLKIEKDKEITFDVSDNLWMLLGSAVHYVLSKIGDDNTEWKLEYLLPDIYGWPGLTIVGKLDRYTMEGIIEDYKITSVWAFLNGLKDEWEAQLNCYDWMCQKIGLSYSGFGRAKGLQINAILRDWQKSKTVDKDYPAIPFLSLDVPQWPFEEQDMYVSSKLHEHKVNSHRKCTAKEKWEREPTYALIKEGRKSAVRVMDTLQTITSWGIDNGYIYPDGTAKQGISIILRKGVCIRCAFYCLVRSVCEFAGE